MEMVVNFCSRPSSVGDSFENNPRRVANKVSHSRTEPSFFILYDFELVLWLFLLNSNIFRRVFDFVWRPSQIIIPCYKSRSPSTPFHSLIGRDSDSRLSQAMRGIKLRSTSKESQVMIHRDRGQPLSEPQGHVLYNQDQRQLPRPESWATINIEPRSTSSPCSNKNFLHKPFQGRKGVA
jgi:hypothetical protein